jgi:3-methyladenine DNA glycosylase/8-oxoguanine DNA glycosylase
LFDGIVACIAGQSITVMAAAVTEARIAALFHPGMELAGRRFFPPPTAEQLAAAEPALIRTSGVTWRRAEAIVTAAKAQLAGELPSDAEAVADPERARAHLLRLPLVGPWTAESALLWGLGAADAFPPNDAALLRAARAAYGLPELDHKGLNRLAEGWRPGRAWAARWLWTALFGPAPDAGCGNSDQKGTRSD